MSTGKDTLARLTLSGLHDKKMNCSFPYSPFAKVTYVELYKIVYFGIINAQSSIGPTEQAISLLFPVYHLFELYLEVHIWNN